MTEYRPGNLEGMLTLGYLSLGLCSIVYTTGYYRTCGDVPALKDDNRLDYHAFEWFVSMGVAWIFPTVTCMISKGLCGFVFNVLGMLGLFLHVATYLWGFAVMTRNVDVLEDDYYELYCIGITYLMYTSVLILFIICLVATDAIANHQNNKNSNDSALSNLQAATIESDKHTTNSNLSRV